jgi:hypothetical protein
MRNLPELRARIAKGEIIPQSEMIEKYYPTHESFLEAANWLKARGFMWLRKK